MPGYDSWKTRSPDDGMEGTEEPSREQQKADYEDELQQKSHRCDACGSDGDLRLVGELLGPNIKIACRKCVGPGIGWFYLRRPGDFDDDDFQQLSSLSKTERGKP